MSENENFKQLTNFGQMLVEGRFVGWKTAERWFVLEKFPLHRKKGPSLRTSVD